MRYLLLCLCLILISCLAVEVVLDGGDKNAAAANSDSKGGKVNANNPKFANAQGLFLTLSQFLESFSLVTQYLSLLSVYLSIEITLL